MIATILEFLMSVFKAIPIVSDWFKKDQLEKDRLAREAVDKEHHKNEESGRPSGEFWDKRHL